MKLDKFKSAILAFALSLATIMYVVIFGLTDASCETLEYTSVWWGIPLFVVSCIFVAYHIVLCIIMRVKRIEWIVKGLFIYQMIGVIAYVLFFIGWVIGMGTENILTNFWSLFRWWSLPFNSALTMLTRVTGIPLKFTLGIFYLARTYISANTYLGIRKDVKYEKEREADRIYAETHKNSLT